MPVDLERICPIDAGSLLNLSGQAQEELAQKKDVGWTPSEPCAKGHRIVGVDQLQFTPQDKRWYQCDNSGQHHRAQHEDEEEIAPWKPKARKAIGHQTA